MNRIPTSFTDKLLKPMCHLTALMLFAFLSACASKAPDLGAATGPIGHVVSYNRVVNTNKSMITLFDPTDIAHHQNEPADWYMHDFAISEDLKTGRFAAVLTGRSGNFDVRLTFGELTPSEQAVAGARGSVRLRVINHRLLLSGGEAWPSVETDYRKYAHDPRWINVPNGDYGVTITALDPTANEVDYVIQMIKVNDMSVVKYAPALPQLIYGQKAAVVGVKAQGLKYAEKCSSVPGKADWIPLSNRTMPIPGGSEALELPRSVHTWALGQQQAGNNAAVPMVLSRNPEVGSFGFFIKPDQWSQSQVLNNGTVRVNTLVRCAVQITDIVASGNKFEIRVKPIPTPRDRLTPVKKRQLMAAFNSWLRYTNDPAWQYKTAMVERSVSDGAMLLGVLNYLELSSKESEHVLPMRNDERADYLIDRLGGPGA